MTWTVLPSDKYSVYKFNQQFLPNELGIFYLKNNLLIQYDNNRFYS